MFRKGDTVVHPEHGAAVIEDISVRVYQGESRKYLKLKVVHGDLTVNVPVESAPEVGLRGVVSKAEAKKVLKVLQEDETVMAA
ncbi:MAG: CarD family transcriptional regulator, partial [Actinobacteria bacterium]|nr:CarD family transcriptional regulator [Actinomycetota bacterium]